VGIARSQGTKCFSETIHTLPRETESFNPGRYSDVFQVCKLSRV
jgi:hypothetical protein